MDDELNLATLQGKTVELYGVDGNSFCIGVDGQRVAYEVIEDPDDGYRSSMEKVVRLPAELGIFSRIPIATVTVAASDEIEGWKLVGADGYEWLTFGTEETDSYYPCFVFAFRPRAPETVTP